MRLARRHGEFRHGVPLRLPRSAVALVVVDETFGQEPGVGPHHARQRSEMLGRLRIALVRHGDAADALGEGSLAKLADLVALQVVDLVADPVGRAGREDEQVRPFGEDVAARRPRHVGLSQAEALEEALLYRQRLGSHRRKAADAAAKLADVHPPSGLVETPTVASQFGEPTGGLEAESDRQTLLAVSSPGHDRVPMAPAQVFRRLYRAIEIGDQNAARFAQRQHQPCVGKVLDGGPEIEPFAARPGAAAGDGGDQARSRVGGSFVAFPAFASESRRRPRSSRMSPECPGRPPRG